MLDLFSGLGGASRAMQEDENWEVITVDIEQKFNPTICADILNLTPDDFRQYGHFDLIWASPPCPHFSIAQVYNNWKKEDGLYIPQNRETIEDIKLVYHTLWLINKLNPDWWFLENPRGMLRHIIGMPKGTVTYCQYGHYIMKPTDLWGRHPPSFEYKSCSYGDSCHVYAPRGFAKGKQHIRDSAERAEVPYGLSLAVKKSVEKPYGMKQITLLKEIEKCLEV